MNSWSEDYLTKLEKIRDQISSSDFRFYNIGRLPLIAKKTEEFSKKCNTCKSNLQALTDLAAMLPGCLLKPDTRKKFGVEKSRIDKHLHKEHHVQYANFYYSYYSFFGILSGLIAGSSLSLVILGVINLNYLLISGILGLLSGQIIGKRLDRKKYQNKDQI